MSQTKSLTDIDKGKVLRDTRNRIGLSQELMAKALNIDKTYLSQLENGWRPVDDFYVSRVAEIEKSNIVNAQQAKDSLTRYSSHPIQEKCHEHLAKWLHEWRDDEARLHWTLVELKRHFPLTENRERTTETLGKIGLAKILPEALQADAESGSSQTTPSTSGKAGGPSTRSRADQGRQRTPPKQAPK